MHYLNRPVAPPRPGCPVLSRPGCSAPPRPGCVALDSAGLLTAKNVKNKPVLINIEKNCPNHWTIIRQCAYCLRRDTAGDLQTMYPEGLPEWVVQYGMEHLRYRNHRPVNLSTCKPDTPVWL